MGLSVAVGTPWLLGRRARASPNAWVIMAIVRQVKGGDDVSDGVAPFLVVPDVRHRPPRDLAVADPTHAYVHVLFPYLKSAGYGPHDPSRESYASKCGRTVNHDKHDKLILR